MKPMHLFYAAALFAGLNIVFILGAAAHTPITTDINWSETIRPIFRKKCMPCHHPGGMDADYVDLTIYGTNAKPGARAWSRAIEEEILSGRMPPWPADSRYGSFANARRLSRQEIDLITAWVRGGSPQGPLRNLPAPEEFAQRAWRHGEPDLIFEMPEAHTLPAGAMDDFVTVRLPVKIEEDVWITGYEFLPGNARIVRRIEAIIHDPEGFAPAPIEMEARKEFDPLADEEELTEIRMRSMPRGPHVIGQWTRGAQPVLAPDEAGRLLRKGSSLELRVTYARPPDDPLDAAHADRSRLGLYLAKEEIDFLVESKRIAAGDPADDPSASLVFDEDAHLIGLSPCMGRLGRKLEILGHYPDGRRRTFLYIPKFEPKWSGAYFFETPIAIPKGTRLEIVGRFDDSDGDAALDFELSAMVDYYVDDHLIAGEADLNFAQQAVALESAEVSAPDDDHLGQAEIHWCPMRGNPCAIRDYHGPGTCEDCAMALRPKAFFFEDKEIASESADWKLSRAGAQPIYWCPNRGRDDHALSDHPRPGRCPICDAELAHGAQFEFMRGWTCLSRSCSKLRAVFYSPGLCSQCGEPVQSMGHMDHTPEHGGEQFFMADNLYHHLEGTMPAAGEFRIYVYDDWKKPLDPRNFAGQVVFERYNDETGEYTEESYDLAAEREGDEHLTARIPPALPSRFHALIWLAGKQKRYDFYFEELTRDPKD